MAIVKIVKEEDWKIVKEYLKGTGVILIPETVLDECFSAELSAAIKEKDGDVLDYDYGDDDPDFYVDVADFPAHTGLLRLQSVILDELLQARH